MLTFHQPQLYFWRHQTIGVIKTKHDAPWGKPGEDRIAKAVDNATLYARGVVVSCKSRAAEKALEVA